MKTKLYQEIDEWFRNKTFIKDPIHGVIHVNNLEAKIIDSPVFIRLHGIKQLGFTYLVYPQAKHSRFEHSLGSMHTAGLIAETIVHNSEDEIKETFNKSFQKELFIELFRLSALLHDLGHVPYSHATENVLLRGLREGWINGRLIEDYEYSLAKNLSLHEAITCNLVKQLITQFKRVGRLPLGILEASLKVLCNDEIYGYWSEYYSEDTIDLVRGVISGRITDIDKIDYLVRDAYNTGAKFGLIDIERLISSVKIVKFESKIKPVIPAKLLSNVEDLYYARYMMFKYVYLHHRVLAIEACYEKALRIVFEKWKKLRRSLISIFGKTPSELGDIFSSRKIFDYAVSKGILIDDSIIDYLLRVAYREANVEEKEWFEAIFLRKKALKPLFKREATFYTIFSKLLGESKLQYTNMTDLLKSLYMRFGDPETLEKEIKEELEKSMDCDFVIKIIPPISSLKEELPLVDVDGFIERIDKVSAFISAIEKAGEAPTIFVYTRKSCQDKTQVIRSLIGVLTKLATS